MYAHENLKKQQIAQLTREIESGLKQLDRQECVDGETSRKKMKQKIECTRKGLKI